jgi:hypothetical protein
MNEGRAELADVAGAPLTTIAYPHGGVDDRVASAARAAGFAAGYTTDPGAVGPATEPLRIGRVEGSFESADRLARELVYELLGAARRR